MEVIETKAGWQVGVACLRDVDPDLYRQFYSLNFRKHSPMRKALVRYRKRWDAYAVWVGGTCVRGWALVTPGRAYRQLRASFYVRPSCRGQRVASALAEGVQYLADNMCCAWGGYHHDDVSMKFLTRVGAFDCYDPPFVEKVWDAEKEKYVWPSPWRRP